MKFRLRFLPLLLALISISLIAGTFASWIYAKDTPEDYSLDINIIGIEGFLWTGADDLPDSVEGEDHAWLIFNIVDGVDASGKEIGLNNPDSEINDRINDRLKGGLLWDEKDYFGSMAITGGDEVSEIFDAKTNGLNFIVHVESETVYYIYTTSVYLGEKGEINWLGNNKTAGKPSIPIGEYIYPIYRTKLVRPNKNSDFEIVETKRGKAKSDWYDENRSNANATQIPCFDINTWVETEMGKSPTTEDAIWTFVGDDPTAYATKGMQHVYYRMTPKKAGNYTVWTDNVDAQIRVLSSDGVTALASGSNVIQPDGTLGISVTWSASADTLYYIEITGDAVMQLHVS